MSGAGKQAASGGCVLTKEELQEFKSEFAEVDKDGSGYIDLHEGTV